MTRLEELQCQPWKNGGGTTRILASGTTHRTGGQQENEPDWRISLAEVRDHGAFSIFDGYRRCATVLSGTGATLNSPGGGNAFLRLKPMAPIWFDGKVPLLARLHDGPISVLNVMLRRGACLADVRIHRKSMVLEPALFRLALTIPDSSHCLLSAAGKEIRLPPGTFFTDSLSHDPLLVHVHEGAIATVAIHDRPRGRS